MNTDTIQLISQIILIFGGAWLTKNHMSATDVQGLIGAAATIIGIAWKFTHFAGATAATAAAPQNVPITKGNGLGPTVPLFLALLLPFAFAGCASNPAVVGHVVSLTDTVFGIDVQTTSTPNNTPRIRLGFVRSVQFIEPAVTNNTINVPQFANTFNMSQTASPFDFGVEENVASQSYLTGNMTNGVTAQPIIPK